MSIQIAPIKQNNTINFKGNAQQNQTNVNLTPKQKADEFISKHKKQIAIGAGIAATIGAVAGVVALVMKGKSVPVVPEKVQEAVQDAVESVDYEKIKSQANGIAYEHYRIENDFCGYTGGSTGLAALYSLAQEFLKKENLGMVWNFIDAMKYKLKNAERAIQEAEPLAEKYKELQKLHPDIVPNRLFQFDNMPFFQKCKALYNAPEVQRFLNSDDWKNNPEVTLEALKKLFGSAN